MWDFFFNILLYFFENMVSLKQK